MPNYVSNKTIEKLKYDLVRNNLISFDNLTEAEKLSEEKGQNLSHTLVEGNFIEEESLLKFIQDNLRIPYVNLEDYSIDKKCLSFVSAEDAKKYRILPLFRIENVLTIAMADPLDLFALNNLMKNVECEVEPVICSERLIMQSINKYYFGKQISSETSGITIDWRDELNDETPDLKQAERIINAIVSQALIEKSPEIILEQIDSGLYVKFKTVDKGIIPRLLAPLCITHLKNICSLDSSITDLPQLGKFSYSSDHVTGVVSTFPSTNGERVVIQLYNPPATIETLSVKQDVKTLLNKKIEQTGVILIAGAKLRGKTFLAYSLLNSIAAKNKNIMTIESIAKYDLKGVNQCELNEKVGFDAEKALKLIDFQSPDVLYIEDITSGKIAENLFNMAKANKLVIAEINAESTKDFQKIFTSCEIETLEKNLNCIILIKDLKNITITESNIKL